MRIVYFLLLMTGFFNLSLAQVSIGSSSMPLAGDTLRYSIAAPDTAVLFNYRQTGANIQWDFDSLIPIAQEVQTYESSASTNYPISNRIAEKIADTLSQGQATIYDVYNFYTSNSTEFALDYRGFSLPGTFPLPSRIRLTQAFDDKDEIYQFPLNYGDRDSSSFNFSFTNIFPPAYYGSEGFRINDVNAWGSIKTPYGTFNCIKVVTDIVAYDTVQFNGNGYGIHSHQREYKWLSPQNRFPILNVSGNVVAGLFVPLRITYRDSMRNIPNILAPQSLFGADTTVVHLGDTLAFYNFSLSLTPVNYQWIFNPSTVQFAGGTSATSEQPMVIFSDTGYYDVSLVSSNAQGKDSLARENYIQVLPPVSISEITGLERNNIILYPNPLVQENLLQISSGEAMEWVRIFNSKAELVLEKQISDEFSTRIQLERKLPSGIYVVEISSNEGRVLKKLISL